MKKRDVIDPIIFAAHYSVEDNKPPIKRCAFRGEYSRTRCMHNVVPGTDFCTLHPEGKLS
jgi:hypothetical protein